MTRSKVRRRSDRTRPAGRLRCPYCHADVAAGWRCERCSALHHLDCMKDHGGCAVFACRPALLRPSVTPVAPGLSGAPARFRALRRWVSENRLRTCAGFVIFVVVLLLAAAVSYSPPRGCYCGGVRVTDDFLRQIRGGGPVASDRPVEPVRVETRAATPVRLDPPAEVEVWPGPRTAADHLAAAESAARAFDWPETRSEASACLALDPTSARAYALRGEANRQTGSYADARRDLDQAIARNPLAAFAWASRGGLREHLNDLEGGLNDCNSAIALDPSLSLGWGHRGVVRYRQGDRAGALADFDSAAELDRSSVWAASWRDRIARQLGVRLR